MVLMEDLKNIDGIEFISDRDIYDSEGMLAVETIRVGKPISVLEMLVSKFKAELSQIGKKYAFNENDDEFIPLRKYFATALKHTLLNDNPEDDDKFVKLRDEIGMGMEAVYYNEIVVPKLMDEVYDLFFIDINHKLLYNFKDGVEDYSFTSKDNGKYGYMKYSSLISDAIDPEEKHSIIKTKTISKIFEEPEFMNMMGPKWSDYYMDRISKIYSNLAQKHIKDNEESLKRIREIANKLQKQTKNIIS